MSEGLNLAVGGDYDDDNDKFSHVLVWVLSASLHHE
jgi:hypothetical protein